MDECLLKLSQRLGDQLRERKWRIATAESCTGGAVAAAVTAIPGSSEWFEYGIVSYADEAKEKLLGVSKDVIAHEGAVSRAVVVEMARGALELSGADIAVSVSGVAGPGGGSPEKPVGMVWFAWATSSDNIKAELRYFEGGRSEIQQQAVIFAIEGARQISSLIDLAAQLFLDPEC